jgi:histidinol-phosphate phosphatase family protein
MSLERPRQAVILAGGLGTRLRPLTDIWPKPMTLFNGKPFLEYLLRELAAQGFERALLLVGYRAESIQAYFGDGSDFDIAIEYSVSPIEFETGARIRAAADKIDPLFMLLYCDNYWPMPFDAMWAVFQEKSPMAMVTVYRNADGYTRSNLRIEDGWIALYDKTRKAENLAGVDIGFIVMHKDVLALMPEGNVSFEATVYPQLVAKRALAAFTTDHRYYSVGTVDRLPTTAAFLARRPTILLDRDGVLNVRPPRADYVKHWGEWCWCEGALEALSLLGKAGCRLLVVSNQPGIARGFMTEETLHDIHWRMVDEAAAVGARLEAIYYCPHNWDEGCECRKPKPGMLFRAQRDFALDLSRCFYIGDDERDEMAANAAFCPFRYVTEEASLLDVVRSLGF